MTWPNDLPGQHTPIRSKRKKKRKKTKTKEKEKEKLRRNRKTQNFTMTRKRNERKGLSKDICWHISSRYPGSRKNSSLNVILNEMVTDINVFWVGRNRRRVRKGTSSLVITKDRKRARDWKFQEFKECPQPKGLLKSVRHHIIFSLSRWQSNRTLFNSRPRDQRALKKERITRNTSLISRIRCPVSIGAANILEITTQSVRNMWGRRAKAKRKCYDFKRFR